MKEVEEDSLFVYIPCLMMHGFVSAFVYSMYICVYQLGLEGSFPFIMPIDNFPAKLSIDMF